MTPTRTGPDPRAWPRDTLALQVPAHPDHVASIRAVVRSSAVVADLALEDVEELQIAVNEAAALLLACVDDGDATALDVQVQMEPGRLCVRLAIAGRPDTSLDRSSLAWMMLAALDPDLRVTEDHTQHVVEIARTRSATPRA